MSRDSTWPRVAELFDELCELDTRERQDRLGQLAAGEPEVAAELRRLLVADGAIDERLEEGAGAFLGATLAGTLLDEASARTPGEGPEGAGVEVGAWRLVRLLGRGGMGEVWEAARQDGDFEQTVALKILRRGLDTDDVLDRFLRERRLLARLEHPKIARLFDGGSTADGRPWFAMERVEGRPLTTYCDAGHLSLSERLRLFLEVCEAVEYAHRSLVIHRDLKPSNVLVSERGEVKLLDFGIAKLVEGDGPDASATRAELRMLTPGHAAPEQFLGGQVTLATDVYALGVMLYQLLTGRLPHRRAPGSPEGLVEAVSRETVLRPSAVVQRDESGRRVGEDDPRRLAQRLRGDLDVIALKALARDPERRYPTVAALAEDLRRHLEGLPIRARPDTLRYRSGKFLGRHRLGVAAAAAAIAIFLGLSGWYTFRLARERDRAQVAAARAEAQFERAELARDFLSRLLQDTDPMQTVAGGQRTVSDLLRSARERVEAELVDQPQLQAEMGLAVARALDGLGEVQEGLELAERSIAKLRELGATGTREFGVGLSRLGQLRIAAGDARGGEAAIREGIAVLQSLPASDEVDRQLISVRTGLHNALSQSGRESEAQEVREAVLRDRARLLGDPEHPDLAVHWYNLGMGYQVVGRHGEAEQAIRKAGRLLVTAHGAGHPRLVNIWLGLSFSRAVQNDFAEAEDLERRAEALLEDQLDESHPLRGSLQMIRANRLLFAGDGRAVAAAREAVATFRRGEDLQLGRALGVLGSALLVDRLYAEASEAFGESLATETERRGEGDARTRLQRVGRAVALWHLSGDPSHLEEATATLEAMRGEGQGDSRELADAAAWTAAALEPSAPQRAVAWRRQAERALAIHFPAGHPWRVSLAGTRR